MFFIKQEYAATYWQSEILPAYITCSMTCTLDILIHKLLRTFKPKIQL